MMRRLGVGFLGLLSGLLLGFIVNDVLARLLMRDGAFPDSLPLALLMGFLTPALGIAGVVASLVLDRRRIRRNPGDGA